MPGNTDELVTLAEAREWLAEQLEEGGITCPCCGQFAKIYKRKLNANMTRLLITAYRMAGLAWFHGPTLLRDGTGDLAKLRYWGLVIEESRARPDGGRTGWWRVTPWGESFAKNLTRMPKYALIYDSRLLKLDPSAGNVSASEALEDKFNYSELMGA
jgi:hypothetical protein